MPRTVALPAKPPPVPAAAAPIRQWRVLADRVAGPHKSKQCADVFEVASPRLGAGPALVAVLADGAGSARLGAQGAHLAVKTLSKAVKRQLRLKYQRRSAQQPAQLLDEATLEHLFRDVRKALWQLAAAKKQPQREVATTLMLAIVTPWASAFAQIGDGAMVAMWQEEYRHVFWPDQGEYVNTTTFVSDRKWHLHCAWHAPVDRLALFSDGLQMLALDYAKHAAHQPFFAGLFRELVDRDVTTLAAPFRAFLTSDAVRQRTDDDVSLVLAAFVAL